MLVNIFSSFQNYIYTLLIIGNFFKSFTFGDFENFNIFQIISFFNDRIFLVIKILEFIEILNYVNFYF